MLSDSQQFWVAHNNQIKIYNNIDKTLKNKNTKK